MNDFRSLQRSNIQRKITKPGDYKIVGVQCTEGLLFERKQVEVMTQEKRTGIKRLY